MKRRIYSITGDITGSRYSEILHLAKETCSCFLLVVREEFGRQALAHAIPAALHPHILEMVHTNKWPGTCLLQGYAEVYKFSFNPDTLAFLVTQAHSLFDWVMPHLPEDLCLLRHDQDDPWLVSIAHEQDAYFELTTDEAASLTHRLPWLQLEESVNQKVP